MAIDIIARAMAANAQGGGEGGTSDYNQLSNQPKINGVILRGNKTLDELGIQPVGNYITNSDLEGYDKTIHQDIDSATTYTIDESEKYVGMQEVINFLSASFEAALNEKQDVINDLGTIRTNASEVINKADKIEVIENTDVTELQPNKYYKWGEVASLSLTLGTPIDGILNEYMFEFVSGATPTTLTLPDTIKWETIPNIEANKKYQISIVNNIALIVGV